MQELCTYETPIDRFLYEEKYIPIIVLAEINLLFNSGLTSFLSATSHQR